MNPDTRKHITEAVETHKKMTAEFEQGGAETVAAIAEVITGSLRQGGTVYLCGNGGSAADAQHIAGELVGRFTRERKAFPAVITRQFFLLGRKASWISAVNKSDIEEMR